MSFVTTRACVGEFSQWLWSFVVCWFNVFWATNEQNTSLNDSFFKRALFAHLAVCPGERRMRFKKSRKKSAFVSRTHENEKHLAFCDYQVYQKCLIFRYMLQMKSPGRRSTWEPLAYGILLTHIALVWSGFNDWKSIEIQMQNHWKYASCILLYPRKYQDNEKKRQPIACIRIVIIRLSSVNIWFLG